MEIWTGCCGVVGVDPGDRTDRNRVEPGGLLIRTRCCRSAVADTRPGTGRSSVVVPDRVGLGDATWTRVGRSSVVVPDRGGLGDATWTSVVVPRTLGDRRRIGHPDRLGSRVGVRHTTGTGGERSAVLEL